jgi:hypothetical protein
MENSLLIEFLKRKNYGLKNLNSSNSLMKQPKSKNFQNQLKPNATIEIFYNNLKPIHAARMRKYARKYSTFDSDSRPNRQP